MAGADDPAFDAELLAQADVQSVGEHDQAGGNLLAVDSAIFCRSALVEIDTALA